MQSTSFMDLTTITNGVAAWLGIWPTPLSLTFELTHRCNLACRYCDRHSALPAEMETRQVLGVLEQFYELGMRRISIDGGEPLLHRDIQCIVDWLVGRGVVVVMNSNGILVPRRLETVRRLKRIKISLDGPPQIHDVMRGEGAFRRAVDGVRAARGAGVEVELTCVVGRHNHRHLEQLLDIVEELGCAVIFQPARSSLLMDRTRDGSGWQLDRHASRAAFRRIASFKWQRTGVANGWASLKHFRWFPHDCRLPCAAGWIMATLDPEGTLYHCDQDDRSERGNNVLTLGAHQAFANLPRTGCSQCWCARVVEGNYAWGCRLPQIAPPLWG